RMPVQVGLGRTAYCVPENSSAGGILAKALVSGEGGIRSLPWAGSVSGTSPARSTGATAMTTNPTLKRRMRIRMIEELTRFLMQHLGDPEVGWPRLQGRHNHGISASTNRCTSKRSAAPEQSTSAWWTRAGSLSVANGTPTVALVFAPSTLSSQLMSPRAVA